MTSDSLADLPATELVAGFRAGRFTPVDVLEATIDRIDQVNPVLNAFVGLDLDSSRAAAEASSVRWADGSPSGAVDGVPVTIKDTMALRGWPTRKGSVQTDPNKLAPEDSPAPARLRESGAVILGKTTAPEFGWKGCSDSPLTGLTRNPWGTDHTTGGSSAGAAAAAATGMGALHTGSDGAGSVRIPAAFTGVFGIKGTFGVIPIYPPSTGGLLSHVGPLTRTVGDAALMLEVIGRPDGRELFPIPDDTSSWIDGLEDGVSGIRIAYTPTWDGYPVHPEVAAAVEQSVRVLEGAGAKVTEVVPSVTLHRDEFQVIWESMLSQPLRHVPESEWHRSDPGLVADTRRGLMLTYNEVLDAESARGELMAQFREVLLSYDLIVSPVMPCTALPLQQDLIEEPWAPGMRMDHWLDWSPFTYPLNLTRHPAASVPIGFDQQGLPIAMQIIGRHFEDRLVLRASRAFEREQPFRMPDVSTLSV